jgi:hypothetical protein
MCAASSSTRHSEGPRTTGSCRKTITLAHGQKGQQRGGIVRGPFRHARTLTKPPSTRLARRWGYPSNFDHGDPSSSPGASPSVGSDTAGPTARTPPNLQEWFAPRLRARVPRCARSHVGSGGPHRTGVARTWRTRRNWQATCLHHIQLRHVLGFRPTAPREGPQPGCLSRGRRVRGRSGTHDGSTSCVCQSHNPAYTRPLATHAKKPPHTANCPVDPQVTPPAGDNPGHVRAQPQLLMRIDCPAHPARAPPIAAVWRLEENPVRAIPVDTPSRMRRAGRVRRSA